MLCRVGIASISINAAYSSAVQAWPCATRSMPGISICSYTIENEFSSSHAADMVQHEHVLPCYCASGFNRSILKLQKPNVLCPQLLLVLECSMRTCTTLQMTNSQC